MTSAPRRTAPIGAAGLAASLLLVSMLARTAGPAELPTLRSDSSPFFTADLSVLRDAEGLPSLVIGVTVPYTEIQWVKSPRGFGASIEFTVAIDPLRSGRSYGGAWQRQLLVPTYASSRSPNATVVERDTIRLLPGRYDVRIGLEDLNADQRSVASDHVEVEDWSRVPIGFSDLEVGVVDSVSGFHPRAGRVFGRDVSRLVGRASIFDRRPGGWPRRYALTLRLRDDSGNALLEEPRNVTAGSSGEAIDLRPTRSDLFIGDYTFEVELTEGRSHWKVSRTFEVEESGPPQGAEWDRMLEPLGYIAEPGEIERLQKLKPADREAGWDEFWRKRDPTPETARNEALIDFIRRVRYCEVHFQGFGPGWRSDMGRIYIRYGPPDQIETRPATAQSPQIEIWYYNQPYRRLVFVDREGFGRYVLLPSGSE